MPFKSLAICMLSFLFWACAPDRSGARLSASAPMGDYKAQPPLVLEMEDKSLRLVYAAALEEQGLYHVIEKDSLGQAARLRIRIQASGEEKMASWWYLGLGLAGPLWPVMPYSSSTELLLEATLWRDGQVQKTMRLVEKGSIELRYYGPYRLGEVQKATDWLHQVLLARFLFLMRGEREDLRAYCVLKEL